MIVFDLYRNWGLNDGDGYLGGDPPVGDDDGRAKILNAPARVLITVYAMRDPLVIKYVGAVISAADGTWRMQGINRSTHYRVIGSDLNAGVNSAIQDWVLPAKLVP